MNAPGRRGDEDLGGSAAKRTLAALEGDSETTTSIEAEWTQHNLGYLKENTK